MTVPVYQNFQSGSITDNPLSSGATTVNSPAFASLVAVANPNTMWLVLDPTGVNGAPEVCSITAHTAASTQVTVARAQQSSSARSHPTGTRWVAGHATKSDLDTGLAHKLLTAKGSLIGASAANAPIELTVGADGQSLSPSTGATPGIKWDWLGLPRFSTLSALTAAITSPAEGMAGVVTGEDRVYMYDGSGWVRIGYYSVAGRTGVTLRRVATQSVTNGTSANVSWDTKDVDSDAFVSGGGPWTTVTIPTGLAGFYLLKIFIAWASNPGSTSYTQLSATNLDLKTVYPSAQSFQYVTAISPFAAADTVIPQVFNGSAGAINITGKLEVYRVGI